MLHLDEIDCKLPDDDDSRMDEDGIPTQSRKLSRASMSV